MNINDSIESIKGVGPKKKQLLNKLGIYNISDILEYYPLKYEDNYNKKNIIDFIQYEKVVFIARLKNRPININKNNKIITKIKLYDNTGSIDIYFFNQPYLKKSFNMNIDYIFTGIVNENKYINGIKYSIYKKYNKEIIPIYALTNNLTQNTIRNIIKIIFDNDITIKENLPEYILKKYNLFSKKESVYNIHFPNDYSSLERARYRLKFEELFILKLSLAKLKYENECSFKKHIYDKNKYTDNIIKKLPYDLTSAQINVLEDIKSDMYSKKSMNRLVQGDVGSGKTIVAILAISIAVSSGYQACLLAPTEVLARQHLEEVSMYINDYNIALLVGSNTKRERRDVLGGIKSGDISIVIGTHAIIQEFVEFNNLSLAITDEQHRFGVKQRLNLKNKGKDLDYLVMSATPIPRSLALIIYGDLDISIIDEMPAGRKKIDTYHVTDIYRERVYKFIKKELDKSRQCYIICPMVDENENMDLKSVNKYAASIACSFNEYNIACIHGKMKAKDKQIIMDDFYNKNIHILVATTVIEVGINVKNASIIIIENAERFGLSQLHQLRGRVGRSNNKSYCILFSDSKSKIFKKRMDIFTKTNNGFKIAQKDLELRGGGDFFGTAQHGIPNLKIANLYEDVEILNLIQSFSKEILVNDEKNIKWNDLLNKSDLYKIL